MIGYGECMSDFGPTVLLSRHVAGRLRVMTSDAMVAEISAKVGIDNPMTSPDDTIISIHAEAAFIQAACDAADDIDLAFKAGLTYATAGTLPAYISRHANTLREGLGLSCHYVKAVRPGMDFVLHEEGNVANLRLTISDQKLQEFPRHRECIFSGVTAQIRSFTKRAFYPDGLSFTHIRRAVGPEVRARLGCPVTFGAEHTEMLLSLSILDAPMISHDEVLKGLLVKQGDSQFAEMGRPEPGIAEKVELLIEAGFPEAMMTAAAVAEQLAMSQRTLSRRLREAHTSYHEILNHVRLRLAQRELVDSDLQIAEIAYRLGFANQASFSVAFWRETGLSPSEFRRNAAGRRATSAGAT